MLYYKPKYLNSVTPSIFTTEPPSVADSMILDSRILSEEKLNLNSKFALLDQFSHREFDYKEYNLTSRNPSSTKRALVQNSRLDVWGETQLKLQRNSFLYTSLDIFEKSSPVTLFIYVKKGDPNTKMRLFCSPKFQQPNRFNAEIETHGRVLKYSSKDGSIFTDQTLYVALLSQNDITITIKSEFAKPILTKRAPQLKQKQEFTPDVEELAEEILRKRRLRQKSLNFINLNISLPKRLRIESPCNTDRLKEFRVKQRVIQKEQSLKRIAQIALHDVVKEIRQKQFTIQRKQMHTGWIYKNWIRFIYLINYVVPSLKNYILTQKRIAERNIKKQILITQFTNKLKRLVLIQGPSIKLRTLQISKIAMKFYIKNQTSKTKQKAQLIITEILKQNIGQYYTVTKGLHTVNLSKNYIKSLVKKCISMLVRHKNKRLEFMQSMKITITQQCRSIYADILKAKQQQFLALPLVQQQQQSQNKNKRDPIYYLIHDQQFVMQIYKKLLTNVLSKWNQDFDAFRRACHEKKRTGIALLLRPLPMEIPSEDVINDYIIDELERRGLINYQYYPLNK